MPGECRTAPYGSWASPLDAAAVVESSVSISEVAVVGDEVWWAELRPSEQGRVMVVRRGADGARVDVLPDGFSARTRVHEYGGGAWWLHERSLFFANWADQRLYRVDDGAEPRPLTPEPSLHHGLRYADGVLSSDGLWVVCVREDHETGAVDPEDSDAREIGSSTHSEPRNEIVAIDAHGGGEVIVLVSGPDFVSNPRISPDGKKLCWLEWHHPAMPWDSTELWVADLSSDAAGIELANGRCVAGGTDESVFQPEWTPDGALLFVSDRSDWWNLYRLEPSQLDTPTVDADPKPPQPKPPYPKPLHMGPIDGEIGLPQWVFGQKRYTQVADGRILCAFARGGTDHLGVIAADGSSLHELDSDFSSVSSLATYGDGAVIVGASPTLETVVALFEADDLDDVPNRDPSNVDGTAEITVLRPSRDSNLGVDWISVPQPITFATTGGRNAYGLFYPPTNPVFCGPEGELPPLIVLSHGGPTSAARPMLNLAVQFWTTRGIGVVDVNYGGSTGFGRRYRRLLDGAWGVVDVDDCVAAAEFLVGESKADPGRLAIKGGSAGGFTTLSALVFRDVFSAGSSLYGVADLEALASDTHKFESRYLDGLIGPYPQARDIYVERSPIHHTDGLNCPLIVFQGLEDEIVPPSQAESMVAALRMKGIAHAYLPFEGEQHGFRLAENIQRVLEAELYFLSRVFGFDPPDSVEPVPIENL